MNRRKPEGIEAVQLRVTLLEIEPPIWRSILVRADTTLHELHRVIQMLFQWYDYHLYRFDIGERGFEAPDEEAEGEDSTRAKLGQLGFRAGDTFEYTYDFGDDWSDPSRGEVRDHGSDRASRDGEHNALREEL